MCSWGQRSILLSINSFSKCSNGIRKCRLFKVGCMGSAVHCSLNVFYNCQHQYWPTTIWPHIHQQTRQSELFAPIHMRQTCYYTCRLLLVQALLYIIHILTLTPWKLERWLLNHCSSWIQKGSNSFHVRKSIKPSIKTSWTTSPA